MQNGEMMNVLRWLHLKTDEPSIKGGHLEKTMNSVTAEKRIGGTVLPPSSNQPISERFPALEEQEITLSFYAPGAQEVNVAGSFNGWQMDSTPLAHSATGNWIVRLMLRSGQYEYRFVVDGLWVDDPEALQHVANPYGGNNSVLMVPLADRAFLL
jgi:hypothetical protein